MRSPKLRGARRYFRKLASWSASVDIKLGAGSWYDLWHTHPDFRGWSLRSGRARRAHLRVLFEAFQRVLRQIADSDQLCQVFVTVNTKDSPGDALYVHTPNPNADNFPHEFGAFEWDGRKVPPWLAEFVDREQFEVGETVSKGEKVYVVTPRGGWGRPSKGKPLGSR